jgi:ribosome biogenesis GTPase
LLQGRICAELRESYRILYSGTEIDARVAGRLRHEARSRLDYPAVGDDVLFVAEHGNPTVQEILPRRSAIVRKAAGTACEEQVIAANVDHLLIVCGLDGDFSVRRIERYAALAASSRVAPVLVLNKADICRDLDHKLLELADIRFPIHVLAAAFGDGIETLEPYLQGTVALVGSSGAGKSTIANALLGRAAQTTAAVRADDSRGRHTTTSRQLFALPSGGFLIDTPGMRELYLWADSDAIDDAFSDIESLALLCRFSDCAHDSEPGCAIRAALGDTLDPERFENYCKLRREQAYLERKVDARAAAQELARWKAIHRDAREHLKFRRRQ